MSSDQRSEFTADGQSTNSRRETPCDIAQPNVITPGMDRHNFRVFFFSSVLTFIAAPAIYVGVIQAALCDRLGASATVANLPASAYTLAFVAPIVFSSLVPYRLERATVVATNVITGCACAIPCLVLFLPFGNTSRIIVTIGSGLIIGLSQSVGGVYKFQCLGRGTSMEGRARTLKITYSLGPVAAVVGSVGAQFILSGNIRFLQFPYNFALIYLIGTICMAGTAVLSNRFTLLELHEQRPPFYQHFVEGVRSYLANRNLVILGVAFLFFNCSLNAIANLTLYTSEVTRHTPDRLSGLIMALRFIFKVPTGFALGATAIRWGIRAPLISAVLLVGGGILWGWVMPGYVFLGAFGLLGAGELGGAYFYNYVISVSSPARGARNLALLNLAMALSGVAPILYGALTDHFGFPASFALGIAMALVGFWLVLKLPAVAAKTLEVTFLRKT